MNTIPPCFEFDRVSFAWPNGPKVLDSQSFSLPRGIFALVQGPSGAGKSSLLRLMNRLEIPQAGSIRYLGQNLENWDPPRLRQAVTYLQQLPVIPDLSVRQTLMFAFQFSVNKDKTLPSDTVLLEQLEAVQLTGVGLDDPAAALSGGQRQRLSLVRALMTEPEVLLLDEPTASLDKDSRAVVADRVETLCKKGMTIVMITHDDYAPSQVPVARLLVDQGRVALCL